MGMMKLVMCVMKINKNRIRRRLGYY